MKKIIISFILLSSIIVACEESKNINQPNDLIDTEVNFTQVQSIIENNCTVCHSINPTQSGVTSAPDRVFLDTPDQISSLASRIKGSLERNSMPPVRSGLSLTDEEKSLINSWIDQGAKI